MTWEHDLFSEHAWPNSDAENGGDIAAQGAPGGPFARQAGLDYYAIRASFQEMAEHLCRAANIDPEGVACYLHCLIHALMTRYSSMVASILVSVAWEAFEFVCWPWRLMLFEHTTDLIWCDRFGDVCGIAGPPPVMLLCCLSSVRVVELFPDLGLAPLLAPFEQPASVIRTFLQQQVAAFGAWVRGR